MTLEDLGLNSFFAEHLSRLKLGELSVARVTSEVKGAYLVRNIEAEYRAQITGTHMFSASSREDYPAVGDWVSIEILDTDRAVIRDIFPRQSILKRTYGEKTISGEKNAVQILATNIDVAFIVESVDRDFSMNRFERYIALTQNSGVQPVLIVNKIDLLSQDELGALLNRLTERFPTIDILLTSTATDHGLDELNTYLSPRTTYCFLGSSGVGKSSLINMLRGEDALKTGSISARSGRGKHTTTARQMYFLANGGIVIDNPGIREVGLTGGSQGIDSFFDEITTTAEQCRYADCTHTHEPGCKVIEAVESDTLIKERYANYLTLRKEAEYYEMSEFEKRKKGRAFGKLLKQVKKQKKYTD